MVLVCLTIGAVINFGVGVWGVRVWAKSRVMPTFVEVNPPAWPCPVPEDWPREPGRTYVDAENSYLSRTSSLSYHQTPARYAVAWQVGWPLSSWRSTQVGTQNEGTVNALGESGGWVVPQPWGDRLGVPFIFYGVMPVGFIVNTLLYALLPAAVFIVVPITRRRLRRRAGRCTACAYNRAGLAPGVVCPERGAAA